MAKRNQLSLLLVLLLGLGHPTDAGTTNVERGRMEDILTLTHSGVQRRAKEFLRPDPQRAGLVCPSPNKPASAFAVPTISEQ